MYIYIFVKCIKTFLFKNVYTYSIRIDVAALIYSVAQMDYKGNKNRRLSQVYETTASDSNVINYRDMTP